MATSPPGFPVLLGLAGKTVLLAYPVLHFSLIYTFPLFVVSVYLYALFHIMIVQQTVAYKPNTCRLQLIHNSGHICLRECSYQML